MSIPKVEYAFRPGRLMKSGRTNPGILVIEGVRSFQCNSFNKDKSEFKYACNERLTVGIKCRAKARVIICQLPDEAPKPVLVSYDLNHDCPLNIPRAVAEQMRHEMKELVRANPQEPFSLAIKKIRNLYAKRYTDTNQEELFDEIIVELGPDKPLERQLLRVRQEIIGNIPTNRDFFDADYFLRRVYGRNHNIIVMDSNRLNADWRERIRKDNPTSSYNWDKLSDHLSV